jgi:hypothetical protein
VEATSSGGRTLEFGEGVGHPVGDEGADVGQVVQADVLGGAFLRGEDAQLALGELTAWS